MSIPKRWIGVLGLMALLASPDQAWAWPEFTSSMSVQCLTTADTRCTSLRFALEIDGEHRLRYLQIYNSDLALWDFGSILEVTDANGMRLEWATASVTMQELHFELVDAVGTAAYEPIYTTVSLRDGSTGTAADLDEHTFQYYAEGYQGLTGTEKFQASGGTTTPEPATAILLGSGLAGVVGAARRRRRRE